MMYAYYITNIFPRKVFVTCFVQSLKLSNAALGQTTTGHVVNLMSNDVVRFDYVSIIVLLFLFATSNIFVNYKFFCRKRSSKNCNVGFLLQAPMFLHYLWIGPLQAIFVLCYLWYLLGIASLASFIILISLIPVQGSMGRLFTKLRFIQMTISMHTFAVADYEIFKNLRLFAGETLFTDVLYM